jgi:hypothetical protein
MEQCWRMGCTRTKGRSPSDMKLFAWVTQKRRESVRSVSITALTSETRFVVVVPPESSNQFDSELKKLFNLAQILISAYNYVNIY